MKTEQQLRQLVTDINGLEEWIESRSKLRDTLDGRIDIAFDTVLNAMDKLEAKKTEFEEAMRDIESKRAWAATASFNKAMQEQHLRHKLREEAVARIRAEVEAEVKATKQ